MLQQPKICAFSASSSFSVNPAKFMLESWDWVTLSVFFVVSAISSFDLSINAAIEFGSNISSFSNSETCLISSSIFLGFCFFSSIFFTFSLFLSGSGTASGFSFFIFFGGACSDTNFSCSFLTFSIIFLALGAKGIFVSSVIWISSTEITGGKSIGFFTKNGRLNVAIKISIICMPDEIITFLYTCYLSL